MEGIRSATFLPLASSVLSMSGSLSIVLSGRRHVARQGSDPLQPGTHRWEGSEVVAALRADVRVYIEGDVSDRGTIPNEKLVVAQMPLHHPEGPEPCSKSCSSSALLWVVISMPHMRQRRGRERLSRRLYCSKNIQRKTCARSSFSSGR